MKNQFLVLAVLVALPILGFAQQPLDPAAIAKFPTYVQFTQIMAQPGFKVSTIVAVGSKTDDIVNVVGSDGKGYAFVTDAEAVNYMDGIGFDFVSFIPLPPPVAGATIIRQILFKKK